MKKALSLLVLLTAWLGSLPEAEANFEDLGSAARPMGMANAFTALATDVNALYYNPAGLSKLSVDEITTSYTRYLLGLSDQSVLGGGYVAGVFGLNELLPIGMKHGVGLAYTNFHLFGTYQEHTVTLGYGLALAPDLSVGANVKGLFSSFTQDAYTATDPLFQQFGYASWGIGIDLGVLWQPLPNYRVAVTVMNVNQPNLALSGDDRVPMIAKLGLAYRSFGLDVVADASYQPNNADWRIAFGVEKWLAERAMAMRAGLVTGAREDRDLSVGATYRAEQVQLDYAFVYPLTGLARTFGTHRLAFSVRFGEGARESDEEFSFVPMVPKALYDAEVAKANAAAEEAKTQVERLRDRLEEAAKATQEAKDAAEAAAKNPASAISNEDQEKLKQELALKELKLSQTLKELTAAQLKLAEVEKARQARIAASRQTRETTSSGQPLMAGEDSPSSFVPRPSSIPRTYTVKEGDTLRSVAKRFYQDEEKWMEIYRLNAGQIRQGIVMPGQTIYLPGGK